MNGHDEKQRLLLMLKYAQSFKNCIKFGVPKHVLYPYIQDLQMEIIYKRKALIHAMTGIDADFQQANLHTLTLPHHIVVLLARSHRVQRELGMIEITAHSEAYQLGKDPYKEWVELIEEHELNKQSESEVNR